MTSSLLKIGQRFGRLVVQELTVSCGYKSEYRCLCDCGQEKIALRHLLRKGSTKSCGCWSKEMVLARNIKRALPFDIGMKFGRLTVVKFSHLVKAKVQSVHYKMYECRCECGRSVVVQREMLTSGGKKSCGCLHKESNIRNAKLRARPLKIGMRFGRLVVKSFIGLIKAKNRPVHYQLFDCVCDCGNKHTVRRESLLDGGTRSCGCLGREFRLRNKKSNRRPFGEAAKRSIFGGYRRNALKRGFCFDLTEDDFSELIKQNCFYCGLPPSNVHKSNHNRGDCVYSGIDRVDNLIGYTLSNVVPACDTCNTAKSERPLKRWTAWLAKIFKHNFQ